jgi:hypothetical protein
MGDERRQGNAEMLERMVRVESMASQTARKLDDFMVEARNERAEIKAGVQGVKDTLASQRSFVAGVIAGVSALWGGILFMWQWVINNRAS